MNIFIKSAGLVVVTVVGLSGCSWSVEGSRSVDSAELSPDSSQLRGRARASEAWSANVSKNSLRSSVAEDFRLVDGRFYLVRHGL